MEDAGKVDIRRKRTDPTYVFGANRWREIKCMCRNTTVHDLLSAPKPPELRPPDLLWATVATGVHKWTTILRRQQTSCP